MAAHVAARFRTCPATGLQIDLRAERLIRAFAVVAVVMLLTGGTAALLVLLTRWPAVRLLDPLWYYRLLTFHGLNMLIFWIIFFEAAILYFAGPILLNARLPAPAWGWVAFVLMLGGALLVDYMVLIAGRADVMFTSYVPLRADPLYYLGLIIFAVGTLIAVIHFFATLLVARHEGRFRRSVPLVVFGATTAAIIALVTLAGGVVAFVPALAWSIGLLPNLDAEVYRLSFWLIGHPSQQINVAAMVSVWYLLATLTVGAVSISEKVSRVAFLLYILFINIASAHHLQVDPGFSSAWKIWNTGYAMHLAVLASMVHGLAVPASIEVAQRRWGFNRGLFEWLWRAPWGNPAFSALVLSIITFGFIGGISGVIFGTEQISIISHNTLRITGHFHGTVVGGTTLAFMGLTYYVLPLIFRRAVVWPGLARWQPWLFGLGIMLFAVSFILSGTYGVPRRHWDIDFTNVQAALRFGFDAPAYLFLTLAALGGLLAIIGGLLYIAITVLTVLFGRPAELQPVRLAPVAASEAEHGHPTIRGTVALNFAFLALFAIYYALNWKWLADVWPVR